MSKMQKAFEKNKKYLILFLVLWIVLEIVLIAPMSVAIAESSVQGKFDLAFFIENLGKEVSSFTAITRIGSAGAGSAFGKGNVILLSRNHAITDERREMSPTLSRGLANISSSMREPPLVRVESYMAKIDVFLLRENIPRSSSVCLSIIKLIYPNSYIFPTSAFPF